MSRGERRGPELFSHSRLSTFEDCPKRFHYQYVLREPRAFESIEGFVGKRVHEVLERLYRAVSRGQRPSLAQVRSRFRALWDEHWHPERVRVVREGTPVDFYRETGERCLEGYYRRHYPFDADETLAVEKRVVFPLDDRGDVAIQGIVDRVVRARDGALEIHDYKTARRIPPQSRLDEDRQLALYQLGLEHERVRAPAVRLVWHYLVHDQVRVSERSREKLAALRAEVAALVERVRAETRFEPRPVPLCGWCAYNDRCPASPLRTASEPAAYEEPRVREEPAVREAPAPPRGQLLLP